MSAAGDDPEALKLSGDLGSEDDYRVVSGGGETPLNGGGVPVGGRHKFGGRGSGRRNLLGSVPLSWMLGQVISEPQFPHLCREGQSCVERRTTVSTHMRC